MEINGDNYRENRFWEKIKNTIIAQRIHSFNSIKDIFEFENYKKSLDKIKHEIP